jgi:ribosomal protein S18 acetylase RimI-like enzyme
MNQLSDEMGRPVMIVREFREVSDFEAYARTLLLTLPCENLEEAREEAHSIMKRLTEDVRELWVAEVGGSSAGFMLLEFELMNKNAEIDWFDIHPDYQRKGVGTILVQKAEKRALVYHCQTITLHTAASNVRMQEFAKKNGFEEIKRLPKFWGEGTEEAYLFSRNVSSTN